MAAAMMSVQSGFNEAAMVEREIVESSSRDSLLTLNDERGDGGDGGALSNDKLRPQERESKISLLSCTCV